MSMLIALVSWFALTKPHPTHTPARPLGAIQVRPGGETWVAGPPTVPGSRMAVLEGDPKKEGIFTMRLEIPAGTRIAPHWHPRDERVTVLAGEARIGFGDAFEERAFTPLPAGSFYINPAMSHHFLDFPKKTVLQITGSGPWELHPIGSVPAKP